MYFFDEIFMKLVNLSFSASFIVVAVVLFRLIFKKAPKWLNCMLWLLVAFRLVCPFSLESALSLLPSAEPITSEQFYYSAEPVVESGIEIIDSVINPVISHTLETDAVASVNKSQIFGFVCGVLWLLGMSAMLIYALVSYLRLKKRVSASAEYKEGIFICDDIDSPFILGVLRPRIYLPSEMTYDDSECVIPHEEAHIKRRDYLWKPFGFLLLSVYWFNPLMWLAYILLCRDIELACDERVIKNMNAEEKKAYSEALLNCAVRKNYIAACPVAFGEVGVKNRIKSVLSYKKPAFWVIVSAAVVSAAIALCFGTNPAAPDFIDCPSELEAAVSRAIIDINSQYNYFGECYTEGHLIYGVEENNGKYKVYMTERFSSFGFENGYFMSQSGHITGVVMTFEKVNDEFKFIDADYTEDGSRLKPSIERLFPKSLVRNVLDDTPAEREELWNQCVVQAQAYLDSIGREAEICSYGDIEHITLTDLGISVDVSNKIANLPISYNTYEIGYYEIVDGGVRYIRRTSYLSEQNVILYTTEEYGTGKITERIEVDGVTGNVISTNGVAKYFNATVIEKVNDLVLVEPFPNTAERAVSDRIWVSLNVKSSVPVPVTYEGLHIRVIYDSAIRTMDTYPCIITDVQAIYLYADVNYVGNYATKTEPTTIAQYVEQETTKADVNELPDDFGICFIFGVFSDNIYDTYNCVIQKDVDVNNDPSVSFTPDRETLKKIYDRIVELKLTEIDKKMTSENLTDSGNVIVISPLVNYEISFTMNGKSYTVSGDSTAFSYAEENPQANSFCELVNFLSDIYYATPEYKSLPEAVVTYS